MRRLLTLSLAMLVASAAAPVHAQLLDPERTTGSLLHSQPKSLDPKEGAAVRKGFAHCIYNVANRKAVALLENSDMETVDVAAAGIRDVKRDLKMESCLGKEVGFDQLSIGLSFPVGLLRDLLAEEAYLATNRVAPALSAAAAPASYNIVSTGDRLARAQSMMAFADCAVRHDVAHADALLRTAPRSDAERSAAAALAPALGQCLVKGQSLVLKPANIRAFIAFAMWSRFGRSESAQ